MPLFCNLSPSWLALRTAPPSSHNQHLIAFQSFINQTSWLNSLTLTLTLCQRHPTISHQTIMPPWSLALVLAITTTQVLTASGFFQTAAPIVWRRTNHMMSIGGTAKRIKLTSTGKLLRRRAFGGHLLAKKSKSRKRAIGTTAQVNGKMARNIKRALGV